MPSKSDFRDYFESLLTEIHKLGYRLTTDKEIDDRRLVTFEKYQIIANFVKTPSGIDFDIFADLSSGVYEIGDLHLITRKMLELKKLGLKYNGREMNTTERLYPEDRTGKETKTSGV